MLVVINCIGIVILRDLIEVKATLNKYEKYLFRYMRELLHYLE